MTGTLTKSPQKQSFCEYLTITGVHPDEIKIIVGNIDNICSYIAERYSGASRSNAFTIFQKLAIQAHTQEQFTKLVKPAIKSAGYDVNKAIVHFYNFFANTKSIEESFASYMVGRYRLGYPYLALYWAAILFERIITNKWRLQDRNWYRRVFDPDQEVSLNIKLAELTDETLKKDSVFLRIDIFQHYIFKYPDGTVEPPKVMSLQPDAQRLADTRMRLTNFRILRNRIMHELHAEIKEEMINNHLEFITYVWLELLPKSFAQQQEKYPDIPPRDMVSTLFNTTADYMIRAVDETTKKEIVADGYTPIYGNDFENLYALREKLLPLRERLNVWLSENNTDLLTDILTPIDTTSAYIWMPMVAQVKKIGRQAGVYNTAVSILVTPLDFRIYLDFGGYAQTDRFSYYQFLKSDAYNNFIKSFSGTDEMRVFDIDWFCFMPKKPASLTSWRNNADSTVDAAQQKLLDAELPITWNRMLHGYILDKSNIGNEGITFGWIEQRLKWIIQFYSEYTAFQPEMSFEDYQKR